MLRFVRNDELAYAAAFRSTFSTHSGQNTGSRFDQPGAVAALSLIDWSRVRRRSG